MFIRQQKDINVLVIEDNPGDFILIEEFLAEYEIFSVDHAKTFHKAKELLQQGDKKYHAILLDLTLPDERGEALIKEVVGYAKTTPIIVLTGYSDMSFSIKSLALGVSDYMLKDELTPLSLWKSIRYSIERKLSSQDLEESERKYRYLFEKNPSPMLIWNRENRKIIDSNLESEFVYGYSSEEFRDLTIDDIQVEGIDLKQNGEVPTAFSPGYLPGIWRHKKKDGEIFFAEINAHPLDYKGFSSVLILVNDVTEKIDLQERMVESALRAEEEERNRIAQELHDGIVQQLVACGMFVQNLYDRAGDDGEMQQEISRLYDLLKKTMIHTRDLSHKLKSAEFEVMSLPDLLNQLTSQLSYLSEINFEFKSFLKNSESVFDVNFKTNIYRVVQELCNNILKHSKASNAVITAENVNETLFISIKDDGIGFDGQEDSTGVGLTNVKSRVQRLGGKIEFKPLPDTGVQVDLEIPVTFDQPD
jgi:PAS domain S-box-containing protein